MPFINRLPIDDATGRAIATQASPVTNDPYLAGDRYSDATAVGLAYVLNVTVPGDATYQDGIARDVHGSVYALIDNPPSAPNRFYTDGVLVDTTGRLCLTTVNAIASYMHGWPLDSIGQVCVTGSAAASTISDVLIWGNGAEGDDAFVGQLYFGTAGSVTGFFSVKATFLADNPGLTLQTFAGFAPPGGQVPASSFTGFSVSSAAGVFVDDAAFAGSPFACLDSLCTSALPLRITFSPPVSAVGFNVAILSTLATVQFYSGATLLDSEDFTTTDQTVFTTFAGYSIGTSVANARVTSGGNTRITSTGDTRIIS